MDQDPVYRRFSGDHVVSPFIFAVRLNDSEPAMAWEKTSMSTVKRCPDDGGVLTDQPLHGRKIPKSL